MEKISKKDIAKKPIYEKAWFWVFVIVGGIVGFYYVGGMINNIIDPEVKIPDVKGLTKLEACEKIENVGLTCKPGYNYDSSELNQKVSSFNVYKKDGSADYSASNSLRTKKSSTIDLSFEETEKQKAEREANESKKKAEEQGDTSTNLEKTSNVSWREFIVEYEAFMDEYVSFMKKYKANPSDATIIADYGKMLQKYSDFEAKAELVKGEISSSDTAEYLEALSRVMQKVSEVQ